MYKRIAMIFTVTAVSAFAQAQSAADLWGSGSASTSTATTTTSAGSSATTLWKDSPSTSPSAASVSSSPVFKEDAATGQRSTRSSAPAFKDDSTTSAVPARTAPVFKESAPAQRKSDASTLWPQASAPGTASGTASGTAPRRSTKSAADLWPAQQTPLAPAVTTAAPLSRQDRQQQKLESRTDADCEECRAKANTVQKLGQFANAYAELASRSLVSQGVAKMMNVTYQRCDADNESMLVTPSYYNPSFHNDDSDDGGSDNRYHGYRGASEMEPGDMPSYNSDDTGHREWFSHRVASSVGGMFYTQKDYAPGCMNMREKPPVFCDGGRSQFGMASGGQAYLNVFNSSDKVGRCSSPNFTTFDCSDLVSAVYIASGLKFYKDQPPSAQVTTASLRAMLHPKPDACMGPAKFSGNQSLQSGDVVLFNTNHSLIIDRVGADPFGLQKMSPSAPCTRINPDNFDITIVQAGVFGGRMGPSRIHYQDLLTTNATTDENQASLIKLAIKACETARSGATQAAAVSVWKKGEDDGASILRAVGLNDPKCFVHKPATHPDCKDPASYACHQPLGAKMKGEECLNNCSFDDTEGSAR